MLRGGWRGRARGGFGDWNENRTGQKHRPKSAYREILDHRANRNTEFPNLHFGKSEAAGSMFFPRILGTNSADFWKTVKSADGETLSILAVDNQPSVIFSLRHIFRAPRYKLTGVENGDAALARLDAGFERFDIIIVDQKMPHLSGVELVSEMKKRGVTSKILVLSAHISDEVRAAFERMNVRVMFPKPFDVVQLRSAVERLAA